MSTENMPEYQVPKSKTRIKEMFDRSVNWIRYIFQKHPLLSTYFTIFYSGWGVQYFK